MDHRLLGATGVKISRLAFGTMSFGGDADAAMSRQLFERCLAAGINHFDTADVYNDGESERLLGSFLAAAGCRDEVVLASKAYFPTSNDVNAVGTSRYHLVRAVEASLKRLATDRIDVYYLHRFDDLTSLDESLRAVDDLVRQGKILYPAVSNFAAWQVQKALGVSERLSLAKVVAMQPMYNLTKRQAEVEILPMAASERLAVMCYSPTAGGLLTGKYSTSERPGGGRLVANEMYRTRYAGDTYFEVAEKFTAMARDRGVHPAALAVAWVASHPAVTAALIGARNLDQLDSVIGALDIPMGEAERAAISALTPAPPPATDRNEEDSAHNYGAR